jgi:N-acetylglucosamine-6-phosphate deacetylase
MFVRDVLGGPGFDLRSVTDSLELTRSGAVGSVDADTTLWASPGWFDLQINGFAGVDLNAGPVTREALQQLTANLQREGVTRYLATLITAPPTALVAAAAAIAAARAEDPSLAHAVAGIHLEGPFISRADGARGAHRLDAICDADIPLFEEVAAAAAGALRLVTLAPEVPGALALIEHLVARGIVVALGHTLADGATLDRAVAAGARLSTHLGNGVPATLPRHPNLIWDQLADDRLYAGAIFDGHHLPVSVMRVLARVKGRERLILTSDAVALARMAPGVYDAAVGGRVELRSDGRLTLAGTPYLAGSASSLLDGVNTALLQVGLDAASALLAASATPRRLLGLFDDDVTIVAVTAAGANPVAIRSAGRWVVDRLASLAPGDESVRGAG